MRTEQEIRKEITIMKNFVKFYKDGYSQTQDLNLAIGINNNKMWIEALEWVLKESEETK